MKRVKYTNNGRDRIVCVVNNSILEFYYQMQGSRERYSLFDIWYSPSVFQEFFRNGQKIDKDTFSLSLNQLHEIKNYRNPRLRKVIELFPVEIDRVIRECVADDWEAEKPKLMREKHTQNAQYISYCGREEIA